MSLADELRQVVRGEVSDAPEARRAASRDQSLFSVMPDVVVAPRDTADVEAVVAFASEKKKEERPVSVTARAAGTDMSGGPLNDSIILDMRHFDRVLEVGERHAVVEPGVYFRDFDRETKKKGLELPSYTASREICTVGGMVANDAGGEKNLKYGKTARYVEELDVVLSDGKTHTLKKLEGDALARKLAELGFEGELYRKIAALVKEHAKEIQGAKPIVSKNSSGYALWDIGDGVRSLNLARLIVGSQGTLGIITKIRFSLIRPKPFSAMLVIFLKDIADLGPMVPEILKDEPDSFESYDDHTFTLAVKYFPELAAQMRAGIVSLGISFLPDLWMLARGGVPKLVLLVEFHADSQGEALAKVRSLRERIDPLSKTESMRIAKNEQAARKYWVMRREAFALLRKKVRGKRAAPFIDDFVVPPLTLPQFLPRLTTLLDSYRFIYAVTGHVGDGNFHIFPLLDPTDPHTPALIDELSHKVYDLVLSYHGSISGEHNDGFIRTPYVEKMFGSTMQRLFNEVNSIFDPLDIFNPGKKVRATFADVLKRLDLKAR